MAARRSFAGRRSKLDSFLDQLGLVPDREIAKKAGVTPENVRSYRKRRGISASWREEAGTAGATPEAKKPRVRRRRRSKKPRARKSKLDPFRDLLGVLSDREVAERASVTAENVRAYRLRHGIPAGWRGEADGARDGKKRTSAKRSAQRSSSGSVRWAYRVVAQTRQGDKEYVIFGQSMAQAVKLAEERLAKLAPGATLRELAVIGEAL